MNSVKLQYHLSYLASLWKKLFRTARMLKSYKNGPVWKLVWGEMGVSPWCVTGFDWRKDYR